MPACVMHMQHGAAAKHEHKAGMVQLTRAVDYRSWMVYMSMMQSVSIQIFTSCITSVKHAVAVHLHFALSRPAMQDAALHGISSTGRTFARYSGVNAVPASAHRRCFCCFLNLVDIVTHFYLS